MTHTRPPELLALKPAALIRPSDETPTVQPNYNKFSESVRTVTPNELQCSMFCGGKRCKYESGREWSDGEMAVDGIYSHWSVRTESRWLGLGDGQVQGGWDWETGKSRGGCGWEMGRFKGGWD